MEGRLLGIRTEEAHLALLMDIGAIGSADIVVSDSTVYQQMVCLRRL